MHQIMTIHNQQGCLPCGSIMSFKFLASSTKTLACSNLHEGRQFICWDFSAFMLHCLFGVNQNTTVFEIVTALPVQNNLNENSTIQHIGEICRDKPVQYFIPDSTVRTSLQSKRGRRGGALNGEYIIVDIVTRIRCQQNLDIICLWFLMTLNNFRLVLCIVAVEACEMIFLSRNAVYG